LNRLFLVTITVRRERGNVIDTTAFGGLWEAANEAEAQGLASAEVWRLAPDFTIPSPPAISDMTDYVREWVANNPPS
jgi:hypothetical protein